MAKKRWSSKRKRQDGSRTAAGGGIALLIIAIAGAMQLADLAQTRHRSGPAFEVSKPPRPPSCPRYLDDEVGHLLCTLPKGYAAFNAPETMIRGEPQVISLVVSVSEASHLLTEAVKSATEDSTAKIEERRVSISPRMKARLDGQGFQITPAETQTVAVPKTGHVEWEWQVTPKEPGNQLLVLTLDAMVPLRSGETPSSQTVMRRKIHVRVTALGRIKDSADWAVVHWPLFVAAGGLLLVAYGLKKARRKWYPIS